MLPLDWTAPGADTIVALALGIALAVAVTSRCPAAAPTAPGADTTVTLRAGIRFAEVATSAAPTAAPAAPGAETFVDFDAGIFSMAAANAPTCCPASFAPSVLIVYVAVLFPNAAPPTADAESRRRSNMVRASGCWTSRALCFASARSTQSGLAAGRCDWSYVVGL